MASNASSSSIAPQDRDILILRGLLESRLMTLTHIATLHFSGKSEAAKKRVQKLKAARLIAERPRKPYEPSVLSLTKTGFKLLFDGGHLDDAWRLGWPAIEKRSRVSDATIRHELQVMDVKAAMCSAVDETDHLYVSEFSTWPKMYQFRARRPGFGDLLTVKPDGFITIEERVSHEEIIEHAFFLEVDRSTETLNTLAQRVLCYRDYYTSGGFAVWHGAPREAYQEFPFRVLIVFKSDARRENFAHELLNLRPPVLSLAWLATYDAVTKQPLAAGWHEPRDYRGQSSDASRRAHQLFSSTHAATAGKT